MGSVLAFVVGGREGKEVEIYPAVFYPRYEMCSLRAVFEAGDTAGTVALRDGQGVLARLGNAWESVCIPWNNNQRLSL